MRVLIFSDLHFRGDYRDGPLMDSLLWVANDVVPEVEPDLIVMAGDTFESFTSIPIPALSNANYCLRELNSLGVPIQWLVGNHDQWSADRTIHSLGWADGGHVTVVDHSKSYSQADLALVPYKRAGEGPELFAGCSGRNLVVHLPIKGIDPRYEDKHGFHKTDFHAAQRVFCGHYHDPADLRYEQTTFHIIGSLCASSFSDRTMPLPRGCILWEHDKVERIANPHSPRYYTCYADEGAWEDIEPGPLVNLRIYASPADVDDIRARVYGMPYGSVEVIPKEVPPEVDRETISIDMPVHEALTEYVDQACPEGLDADRLKQSGKELLGGEGS